MELLNNNLSRKQMEFLAACLLPLSLPSYECDRLNFQPAEKIAIKGACIYFVISQEEIVYVGISTALAHRWSTHTVRHRVERPTRLAYIQLPQLEWCDSLALERALIRHFQPRLNESHKSRPLYEVREEQKRKDRKRPLLSMATRGAVEVQE